MASGGTPSTKREDFYGGDIPWLRTQEVNFSRIWDTEIKITQDGLTGSAAKWIAPDSVIVAMYGASAGRVAINKIPLTTNQACCNLTVDPDRGYRFVYYALLSRFDALEGLAKGAAQRNLNAGQVRTFKIPAAAAAAAPLLLPLAGIASLAFAPLYAALGAILGLSTGFVLVRTGGGARFQRFAFRSVNAYLVALMVVLAVDRLARAL